MSAPTTESDKVAQFAELWETIGLDDRTIDIQCTETMRPPTKVLEDDMQQSLPRLPRLLGSSGRDTMPELRFKEKLGEGGMGLVSLASQVPIGRDVAVKGLREETRSREMRLALLREGWTMGLLEHPNIVPVYTLGRDEDDEPVIVMKRIGGVSWIELMRDPHKAPREFDSEDPLDWHIDILSQVCNAVHYAHSKGIIHRDLKPENVMIGEFGEVYVLDWGIAVSLVDDPEHRLPTVAQVTSPAGTPSYMAPEMVTGEGDKLSERTDVYLLGAILHEILTGRPPHEAETLYKMMFRAYGSQPHDYDVSVPQALVDICHRAMAADPDERFQSAEAFRHALIDFKQHREALALAGEASVRLDALRTLLDGSGQGSAGEAQVYKVFGECRFGFAQALRVEADNPVARRGLQDVLELMADRELERGAFQAASLLIRDFPQPRPDFDRRLEDLGERLESREQEFEDLQKIKHEVDPNVGRASRSMLVFALGAVLSGMGVLLYFGLQYFRISVSYPMLVAHGAVLLAGFLTTLAIFRKQLMQNSANRRMMLCLMVAMVGTVAYRSLVWLTELPLAEALAAEILFYGVECAMMGVALDRRILWAAAAYALGGMVGAFTLDYMVLNLALTNFVAMSALAWALWPKPLHDC